MDVKNLLFQLKWVQINPTLVNYYQNSIRDVFDDETLSIFYQKWCFMKENLDLAEESDKKAINARVRTRTVPEIPPPDGLTTLQEALITSNKAQVTIRVELDNIFANKELPVSLKNILGLEFLKDARGDMYPYVLGNTPDEVLLEWKIFYLNPFRLESHISGLKKRNFISFKILKEVFERLPLNKLESLIIENLKKELALEEKICSIVLLLNLSAQENDIQNKARLILSNLVKEYKKSNNLLDAPDDWVVSIVSELV